MAWIQSHQTIAGHPKTRKLAHMLGISKPAAIGHLHCFWWWALDYADDGDLADLDALDIAIGAEWDGDPDTFFNAMVFVGFIDSDEVGDARIHDWHDYAGKLVDRRKANAERMRQARANDINERASHVQRTQRARVEPEKSRQDKSREEGANAPSAGDPAPKPTKYTTDFETFWKAYPTGHGVKKSAFEQWRKIAAAERQAVMDGLESWKRCDRWQRGFVKDAQRWLRDRQWEDEPPAAPSGSLTPHPGGARPLHEITDPADIIPSPTRGYSQDQLRRLAELERQREAS